MKRAREAIQASLTGRFISLLAVNAILVILSAASSNELAESKDPFHGNAHMWHREPFSQCVVRMHSNGGLNPSS